MWPLTLNLLVVLSIFLLTYIIHDCCCEPSQPYNYYDQEQTTHARGTYFLDEDQDTYYTQEAIQKIKELIEKELWNYRSNSIKNADEAVVETTTEEKPSKFKTTKELPATTANPRTKTISIPNVKFEKRKKTFPKLLGHKYGLKLIKQPINVTKSNEICSKIMQCEKCLPPCGWCHNRGCTNKAEQLCPEVARTHKSTYLSSCPRIIHNGPILAPAGTRSTIKLKLYAPDPEIYDHKIICQIKLRDRLTHLKGKITNDDVSCYPVTLGTGEEGLYNGTLRLVWGGAQRLSNKILIIVYRCEKLAYDFESCNVLSKQFSCKWMEKQKKCVASPEAVTL